MNKEITNQFSIDLKKENDYEAHYILWNDPKQEISMMFRYTLLKTPDPKTSKAQVWACFWDGKKTENNVGWIKEYSFNDFKLLNDNYRLEIAQSGVDKTEAWGHISEGSSQIKWRFNIDASKSIEVDRFPGVEQYHFFPRFYSSYCKHKLTGWVEVNQDRYNVYQVNASDGHYTNLQNLTSWSWGNCVNFEEDPDFLFEGITTYYNDWTSPSTWLFFYWKGKLYQSNIIDAMFINKELNSTINCWSFRSEKEDVCFEGTMMADPETMISLTHPRPDGNLYTTITLNATLVIDIYTRNICGDWEKNQTLTSKKKATFEVTKPFNTPLVKRKFSKI
jgi:hypothetical protein